MHPLQLNSYVFPRIEIEGNPEFDPEKFTPDVAGEVEMDARISVQEDKDEEGVFGVGLIVKSLQHPTVEMPYRIQFEVFGAFALSSEFSANKEVRATALQNAASLLYSAARDFVLTVTSRGPWQGYLLPTATLEIGEQVSVEAKETSRSKKVLTATKPKAKRKVERK